MTPMTDSVRHSRTTGHAYSGGKYAILNTATGKFLPLTRPFGSVTAAYKWLDRGGYSDDYETRTWAEYQESIKGGA